MPARKTYTTTEVAKLAGIHPRTLERWLRQGKVAEPARNRSNERVYSEDDVAAIVSFATRLYPPPKRGRP